MVLMRRKSSFADPASLPPSASAPTLPRIGAIPPEHTLRSASSHYLPERRFHGQLPTSRGDAVKLASWMQGELRLYKATNTSLTDWHFVNVLYATNQTAGRTLLNDNTWASEMRDCPTCPAHSVSNMFECP